MEALDLLTYDCWMEVLLRVRAPEDLKSCFEACLTFQDILRKKKNHFMFSLILPHIWPYLAEQVENRDHLVQFNDVLKCRLVCKTWCKSADKLFEYLFRRKYIFNSAEETEQFLQTFASHNGNPFVGRNVVLPLLSPLLLDEAAEGPNPHEDPEESLHVTKLRQLLERFGREIFFLNLQERTQNEHVAFCKNLRKVLNYLPDLRGLTVDGRLRMGIEHGLNEEEEAEITTYITANPLPALPQLEHLDAYNVSVLLARPLVEKYAQQLKSLRVGDPSGFPEQGLQICSLQALEFNRLDASTSLNCLGQLRSPLRRLTLRVSQNSNNVDVWAIDTLFRNIRHLPIQQLDISIRDVFLGESGSLPAEERPFHESITRVSFICPSGSASLNFLLYCPKLEDILIHRGSPPLGIRAGHPNGVAESLDVNDLLEQEGYDLYSSTIWEKLPALKSFMLENCVRGEDPNDLEWRWDYYRRDEYEKRKLENGEVAG